jgi:hypothetical protein
LPDDRPTSHSKDPKSIGEKTPICRAKSLLTAPVDQEMVMMDIKSGRYVGLDDIASVIWQRLETPRSFGELVDSLVADYEADRPVIADDVRALLVDMAAHGVVTLD